MLTPWGLFSPIMLQIGPLVSKEKIYETWVMDDNGHPTDYKSSHNPVLPIKEHTKLKRKTVIFARGISIKINAWEEKDILL